MHGDEPNYIVIDDPHAPSEGKREEVQRWYDTVIGARADIEVAFAGPFVITLASPIVQTYPSTAALRRELHDPRTPRARKCRVYSLLLYRRHRGW